MLRVTSGKVRGFKLDVPGAAEVRPPLEMARQAIFNILGQDFEGCRVVDLFAGSGIMGIEALSRGAERAVFVERNREAVATLKRNLDKTRLTDSAAVVGADAFNTSRYLTGEHDIDVVFVDPPFEMIRSHDTRERVSGLVDALFDSPALSDGAIVVMRAPKGERLDPPPARAVLDDDRQYGRSRVLFYVRKREEAQSGGGEGDRV